MSEPALRETRDAPLANTFGINARARRLIDVADVDALPMALVDAGRDALLLGSGSNLLIVADDVDAVVHATDARIELIETLGDDVRIRAAAGVVWHDFVMHTLTQGWYGLENLALIPGTVGASPIQNIGAYGVEVMDLIDAVQVHDRATGETRWWSHDACGFSYRDSVFKSDPQRYAVMRADFRLSLIPHANLGYAGIGEELQAMSIDEPTPRNIADAVIALRRRKLPDPLVIGNAGSFFKNPIVDVATADGLLAQHPGMPVFHAGDPSQRKLSAAWLIDQSGWKGHRDGDAGVSPGHALVLVNHGNASGAQLLALARRIADSVHEGFGIHIEPEPRLIGATW
ncbi:UDP-N-acetylmuramate dehydrogenase [Solilutibacter tolerans]|uniref:UDP-N-acetylenolpyruvoylglucosamine reductase n=1 Tax=Solilutibacter tolerans TaxID=1604334 RepID=A0A1N6VMS7_9GAMM|nr:UDP-N-acetylmuramate dehydrogenase [Lysobacter tolerans]SIQ79048.1 UDP-N-acetylmuramate dehydrogenase [Lysobacter tolerans]